MGKLILSPLFKGPINIVNEQPGISPNQTLNAQPAPIKEVIEVIKEVVVEKVVEKPVIVEKVEYNTVEVPVYIEVPKEVVVEKIVEKIVEKHVPIPVEVIKEVPVEVVKKVPVRIPVIKIQNSKWLKALLVIETLVLLGLLVKQIL